ncbi:MAG: hypothetical protein LBD96_03175 [Treponema sp.]|nr:hypothetical protein [Treponema sp.]
MKATGPIGRSLQCEVCGKDIRSCRNCRFYSSQASGECQEPQAAADPPRDRERANFCDWFSLDPKRCSPTAGQQREKDRLQARAAFDKLFGNDG